MSELFGQTLPQKMISYAQCLSKQLLVTQVGEIWNSLLEDLERFDTAFDELGGDQL